MKGHQRYRYHKSSKIEYRLWMIVEHVDESDESQNRRSLKEVFKEGNLGKLLNFSASPQKSDIELHLIFFLAKLATKSSASDGPSVRVYTDARST